MNESETRPAAALLAQAAVIIPWQMTDCVREQALRWVVNVYEASGFSVFIGDLSVTEPWRKAVAINIGIKNAFASPNGNLFQTLVISDADVCVDPAQLFASIQDVDSSKHSWSIPFSSIVRFNEPTSKRIIDGHESADRLAWLPASYAEREYSHTAAGGVVVIHRDVWDLVPMDPRFVGYGGEDFSWADALTTLIGTNSKHDGRLYHLWHPPQLRVSRQVGSKESLALRRQYQSAVGKTTLMYRLAEESKAALQDLQTLVGQLTAPVTGAAS